MTVDGVKKFFVEESHERLTSSFADPAYIHAASAFIEAVAEFGVVQSRINVDDFGIFEHTGIERLIGSFIDQYPFYEVPLEKITVIQFIGRDDPGSGYSSLVSSIKDVSERLRIYSDRFNIEVVLNLYVQAIEPDPAKDIAACVPAGLFEEVGVYYDFTGADDKSFQAVKLSLGTLLDDHVFSDPRVKLGNFPFCLLPSRSFRFLYREITGHLKGDIFAQRKLIKELNSERIEYAGLCRECRCRVPCYIYTQIGENPYLTAFVHPRIEDTVVFSGGSLSDADRSGRDGVVWAPPAEQGDLLGAVLEGFSNMLIIDGFFYNRFPCTTFEVMMSMEKGINVFGASSIGALRAAELDGYGMTGSGYVYEYLKGMDVMPYHAVAQTYRDDYSPLTVPLVQVKYFLEKALEAGVVNEKAMKSCFDAAENMHFTSLTFQYFFKALGEDSVLPTDALSGLRGFYDEKGDEFFNIKRIDALALLDSYRSELEGRADDYSERAMSTAREKYTGMLVDRYRHGPDLTLPDGWRDAVHAEGAGENDVSRDRRAFPAKKTADLARRLFDGFDLPLAETTRYDAADSYILSVFLPLFYFLEYSPSSATGNGDVYDEALASAWMELVERAPVCGIQLEGYQAAPGDVEELPLEELPVYYNSGELPEARRSMLEEMGDVLVTDILSGQDILVPRTALMFKSSGTDGNASGNTYSEAVLYGLYELVERDTSQVYLFDSACRDSMQDLMIDPGSISSERSRRIISQFEEKGCGIVLFMMPNVYSLSCVRCMVYDRNRGIECHGSTAVRSDFESAVYAALHEAYMQYITYFVGTRDDYHSLVVSRNFRVAYENAQKVYFKDPVYNVLVPGPAEFASVEDELDSVLKKLADAGVNRILAADISPADKYVLKAVKMIVPGMELWFIPRYVPSPWLKKKAETTVDLIRKCKGG